jgi:hypothetical protein
VITAIGASAAGCLLLLFVVVPRARLRRSEHFVAGPGSAAALDSGPP